MCFCPSCRSKQTVSSIICQVFALQWCLGPGAKKKRKKSRPGIHQGIIHSSSGAFSTDQDLLSPRRCDLVRLVPPHIVLPTTTWTYRSHH
jgi:hypothetical protein